MSASIRSYGRKKGINPHFSAERPTPSTTPIPDSYSYESWDAPPFDQGDHGTCVANGSAGDQEFYHAKRGFGPISISRAAIYAKAKFAYEPDDIADDGLAVTDGLMVMQQFGYVLESDWPYPPLDSSAPGNILIDPPDHLWHTDFKERAYISIDPLDNDQALRLFIDHGPQVIGMDFPLEWENIGADGFCDPTLARSEAGGHCVRRIAYDLHKFGGAWRYRNSWGTSYGANGDFWVPFSAQSICPQFWPDEAYATRFLEHPAK